MSERPDTAATCVRVKSIDHVTLVVRDLERSRGFYVGLLGMVEVARPGFNFAGAWFQAGSTQIHLIEQHAASGPAGVRAPENCKLSRTGHFAFELDDAETALAWLKVQGIVPASGPQRRPDGPTQFYLQDPDGHLVELFSRG